MNLHDIATELVAELRRPDMKSMIEGFVRQTVLQCHSSQEFSRDIVEEVISIPEPAAVVKLQLPPGYRRFLRIAPCSAEGIPVATRSGVHGFEFVSPKDLFTMAGNPLTDICYVAGPSLTVKASAAVAHIFMQYFKLPDVQDLQTETWICRDYPELIKLGARTRYYVLTKNELAGPSTDMFNQDLVTLTSHLGGYK